MELDLIERPYRRSAKLIAIGLISLLYSMLAIGSLVSYLLFGTGLKVLVTLISLPWIAFGLALGFVALTAKLPKPAEEFQLEYEDALKEVKEMIEEWKRRNERGGVSETSREG
ncbi:hypothetical protein [Ignicoccus islandicus]|nr:hypothetical protein [Ignicoccus islandicus]